MNRYLGAIASALLVSLALIAPFAHAAAPQTINYQGYLTSPAGAPVNTTVSMTFRLYNVASGSSALWNETQPSVSVANGSFGVTLGSVTPITLPFDVPYWFSVAVNADAEMSPRQPLASSPYAFRATTASELDSFAFISPTQIGGGLQGQILASNFGPPNWTSSPTIGGILTLQGGLELTNFATITKFGSRYLHSNGSGNIFLGANAGNLGGGAGNNTAVGELALPNVNGSNNTALGRGAGSTTNGGNNNTFVGTNAGSGLGANSSGNIMIGNGAGSVNNAGSANNIYIGNAGNAVDGSAIRIGTPGTQLSTFIAGISGFVSGGGTTVFINSQGQLGTSTSSRRYKDSIADMDEASSALMKLRPVTFHYKSDQAPAGRELQYGLIAEEVDETYPSLVIRGLDGQIETVKYHFLPPMLLNEFQKQQRTIQSQAARLQVLERELREIKSQIGRK
ncbi:MAG: tail fiber domain-containing protein [Betaproteobacteria bacterium]|nr:tail fiber domain-containing protein [Betaproteobacteria bacterium]